MESPPSRLFQRSSSPSEPPAEDIPDEIAPETRRAWSGSATQRTSRSPGCIAATRPATTRGARKLVATKRPRLRPMCCFRIGTIAVWGILRPSGWRKSAVTANQSTIPPISPASEICSALG